MAAFAWEALDARGRREKGFLEADSERQVRRQLRERGLMPVSVAPAAGPALPSARHRHGTRLPAGTVVLFSRLLGSLLESGLPLDDALSAIARQGADEALRQVVLEVRSRVLEGRPLAEALGQFPRAFPEAYCATVAAGEQTRVLPLVLLRLADYLERRQGVQQKIRLALIYPAVLVCVSIAIVVGLLTFVVPEIVQVFEHSERPLPTLTRALLGLSGFLGRWYWALLLGVAASVAAWRIAARREAVRRRLHTLALRLPLVGRLVRENEAARFARTLGLLLQSGLGMLESLGIARQSVANLVLRDELAHAAARVREGEALGSALAACAHLPPLLAHLAGSGEQTGELPRMLETAALASERDVELRLTVGLNLLEPALILTMGLLVLGIVLAVLLPIFEMNRFV